VTVGSLVARCHRIDGPAAEALKMKPQRGDGISRFLKGKKRDGASHRFSASMAEAAARRQKST